MKSQAKTTNNASAKPYKRLLIQAKNLQANAKANVYKRVKLLVQVFDDADFRIDYGADDFVLAGLLDQYIADIGWGFMELRSIIEHFPDEADWKTGRLTKMHNEVVKARRAKATADKQESPPVRRKPHRIAKADYEAVKNENRELRAKYKAACSRGLNRQEMPSNESSNGKPPEVETLRKQLAAAKKRIAELEVENAELKRQLAEIDKAALCA